MKFFYGYVFKAMFCVFPLGPGEDEDDMEDVGASMPKKSDPLDATDEVVVTLRALHRNAMEQEPFFVAVAIVFGLVYPSECAFSTIIVYVFTACRWIHWFSYLCHLQPFRSFSFVFGLVCTLIMSINTILAITPAKATVK